MEIYERISVTSPRKSLQDGYPIHPEKNESALSESHSCCFRDTECTCQSTAHTIAGCVKGTAFTLGSLALFQLYYI